jgi:hypothetical protein
LATSMIVPIYQPIGLQLARRPTLGLRLDACARRLKMKTSVLGRRNFLGRGSYVGGHTHVFLGEDGTSWPTPIDSCQSEEIRDRWSNNRPSENNLSVASNSNHKSYELKLLASFAQCYRGKLPLNRLPLIPLEMAERIIKAGGLVEWINGDRKRGDRFWKIVREQSAASASSSPGRQAS